MTVSYTHLDVYKRQPEVVDEKDFTAYENTQTGVKVTLPACSVVTLRLSK